MANFTTRKSTKFKLKTKYANVAQSVVHRLGKEILAPKKD